MIQRTLFESLGRVRSPRIARASDPATSHQSAVDTTKRLGKIHARVMACFSDLAEKLTAREAASLCFERDNSVEVETYRKRAKELVDAGKLIVCGNRACIVTGKQASVYRRAGR